VVISTRKGVNMYERSGFCTKCGRETEISHRGLCRECSKKGIQENIEKLKKGKEICQRTKKKRQEKYKIIPAIKQKQQERDQKKQPSIRKGIW
jgi:NMD protein affecting ribosome stability and mRNA decay